MKEIISKSGYTLAQIQSKSRSKELVTIRWLIAEYLKEQGHTLKQIGILLNRNHSTVVHGLNQLEYMKKDECVKEWREKLNKSREYI